MNRFLASFCVVFGSACGFVQSDASTPFPSDGVGTFQDAASIEVCLGAARVISPNLATGTTALCVPSEQKVRSCAADDECQGLEKCICGRCIVEPCQGGSTCVDGNVCRGRRCTKGCAEDSDCLAQERCISGGCAKTCKNNRDCHYGERCDSLDDVCVVSLCGTGSSCGAGSECESVAEIRELREPMYLGDEPFAFVQLNSGDGQALYRARIVSPNAWRIDPPEPVFVMVGETIVGGPSVVRRNGSIDLYAAVGVPSRIVQAQSTDDGKTFTLFLDPVLVAAEPWENGAVGSPAVFDFRGQTYLLYEGGDRAGIGLARVTANGAERTQPNPILTAKDVEDPIFWRQITHVGAPFAVVANDDVRILFTARGIEGFSATSGATNLPPDANDSIGLVTTADLQTFALFPTGPLYARIVNLRAYLGESEPTMRLSSSGAEMVFVSSDASGEGRTGIVRVVGRGFGN